MYELIGCPSYKKLLLKTIKTQIKLYKSPYVLIVKNVGLLNANTVLSISMTQI